MCWRESDIAASPTEWTKIVTPITFAGTACADERADGRLQRRRLVAAPSGSGAVVEDAPGEPAPTAHRPETESVADATPLVLELEAMNALVRYLEKRFRRH